MSLFRDKLWLEPNLLIPNAKPIGDVELDPSNAFSSLFDRVYLMQDNLPAIGAGVISDLAGTDNLITNGVLSGIGPLGNFVETTGSTRIYQDTGQTKSVHAGNITILVMAKFKSAGFNNQIVCADSNVTGQRDFQFRWNSSNVLEFIPFVGGAPFSTTGVTAKNVTDIYVAGATYDGETAKVFLNGALEGSNSTPSGNLDADNSRLTIGARGTSTSTLSFADPGTNENYLVYISPTALTDTEMYEITTDLLQIVSPRETYFIPSVTAVGGVTPLTAFTPNTQISVRSH